LHNDEDSTHEGMWWYPTTWFHNPEDNLKGQIFTAFPLLMWSRSSSLKWIFSEKLGAWTKSTENIGTNFILLHDHLHYVQQSRKVQNASNVQCLDIWLDRILTMIGIQATW